MATNQATVVFTHNGQNFAVTTAVVGEGSSGVIELPDNTFVKVTRHRNSNAVAREDRRLVIDGVSPIDGNCLPSGKTYKAEFVA